MRKQENMTFANAHNALADSGYTPARMFKQASLGNDTGSVQLLQTVSPDEQGSLYVRLTHAKKSLQSKDGRAQGVIDILLSDDPAHLVARKFAEELARERGDEWGMMVHRSALAELDPGGAQGVREIPSQIESRKIESTSNQPSFSLSTSEVQLLRQTPMVTETLADLFRDQGHHRMAAAMYKRLLSENYRETVLEKLRTVTRQSTGSVRPSSDDLAR